MRSANWCSGRVSTWMRVYTPILTGARDGASSGDFSTGGGDVALAVKAAQGRNLRQPAELLLRPEVLALTPQRGRLPRQPASAP
ncbi:hypothetical protein CHELA17_64598 [Chelatococcus asaccharovorans]|nr:hypothetical protein CHELA17_64598 [Chelatococcus asaccharovorans]